MATITVTSDDPLTLTIALSAKDARAVASEAVSKGVGNVDPSAHLVAQLEGCIDAMVRRYQERVTNEMLEKFNAATPQQQAAAITAVGGALPT